jgi:phage tail sheath protein FI
MSAYKDRRTPGVYITELSAFPPSVVGVQTAVPAFIGYTQTAAINGKPVFMKPIRIGSLADFEEIFGIGYEPVYLIAAATPDQVTANAYDFEVYKNGPGMLPADKGEKFYKLNPKDTAQFNLYNSLRLFYANGGGNCYVVSVGRYKTAEDNAEKKKVEAQERAATAEARQGEARRRAEAAVREAGKAETPEQKTAAEARAAEALEEAEQAEAEATPAPVSSVQVKDLLAGLDVIRDQSGPTMLVVPEAVLLPPTDTKVPYASTDFTQVVQAMLRQCGDLQDRVAILDVYGSQHATKQNLEAIITAFRGAVSDKFLNYGMAYFPFLNTTVIGAGEFTYENVDAASLPALTDILNWENYNLYFKGPDAGDGGSRYKEIKGYITQMSSPQTPEGVVQLNQNLTATLPLLADIERLMTARNDTLPPSPAMAGVYTFIDATRGVWSAPANTGLSSVVRPTFKIDDLQQADLNRPTDGKAVDAIREFTGRGTLVWGARTLDGNSNDFRYIQVRRTLIYIEQSVKNALTGFVFAANDGNTWVTVTALVSNFLQDLWSRSGLMGATASEAFDVQCGLGSTMTPTDVLQGYMIVQVRVQMLRPAEFIELTFKQKMEGIS